MSLFEKIAVVTADKELNNQESFLLTLCKWGDKQYRNQSIIELATLLNNNSSPAFMEQTATYILSKEPEYNNLETTYKTFDELVFSTYKLYQITQLSPDFLQVLQDFYAKNPSHPLSPLFALLNILATEQLEDKTLFQESCRQLQKFYPGSLYDAAIRINLLADLFPSLIKKIVNIKGTDEEILEKQIVTITTPFKKDCEELLTRFHFVEATRKILLEFTGAFKETTPKSFFLRWIDFLQPHFSAYHEGMELHKSKIYFLKRLGLELEVDQIVKEHLLLFPTSPFKQEMLFLRASYQLRNGEMQSALGFYQAIINEKHPKWIRVAEDDLLQFVKGIPVHEKSQKHQDFFEQLLQFPLDPIKSSEIYYCYTEFLKRLAAIAGKTRRNEILDRILLTIEEMKNKFGDNYFTRLAESTKNEIRSGSFSQSVQINQLSNIFFLLLSLAFLAIYIMTWFQYTWVFFILSGIIILTIGVLIILKLFTDFF